MNKIEPFDFISLGPDSCWKCDIFNDSFELGYVIESTVDWKVGELVELRHKFESISENDIYYPHESEDLNRFEKLKIDYARRKAREERKLSFVQKYSDFLKYYKKPRQELLG